MNTILFRLIKQFLSLAKWETWLKFLRRLSFICAMSLEALIVGVMIRLNYKQFLIIFLLLFDFFKYLSENLKET